MMTRRTVLRSVVAVSSCGIAGCSASDDASQAESQFRTRLTDAGIELTDSSQERPADSVSITYVPRSGNQNVIADEIGTIIGIFFQQVDQGWDVRRLDGTIVSPDEQPVAKWFAKVEWYEQLQANELTANELSIQVLETLSPIEDSS
jgi:hypothetical protein